MKTDKVLNLNKENFQQEVMDSEQPVLVDFWAPWCGPCKMLGPIIDELGISFDGRVKIAKVNVDEAREVASMFQIMSVPTVLLFEKGKVVEKMVGLRTKEAFEEIINKYIK